MPSTVQTWGDSSPALSEWTRREQNELRAKLAAEVPGGDAHLRAVRIARPLDEDCDYQPGHAASTCQVSWTRHDHGERVDYLVTCCWDCLMAVVRDALSGGTTWPVEVLVGLIQTTMRVEIRDPSRDRDLGPGCLIPGTRYVEVSTSCPQCGQLRGEPIRTRQTVQGSVITPHSWRNPCGHRESTDALLVEDAVLGQAAA